MIIGAGLFFLAAFELTAQKIEQAEVEPQSGLRLRSHPTITSQTLGVIPRGTTVVILRENEPVILGGVSGRWTRVRWGTTTGWVFGAYLKRLKQDVKKEIPVVTIDSPANGWTALNLVTIKGRVLNDADINELKFIFNGNERFIPVRAGNYVQNVILGPGANYVKVEARNSAGMTSASIKLTTNNERLDMKLVCSWDTDRTYIDLHITDPSGETVNWQHTRSKIGGNLLGSDIYGYGPQIFTLPRGIPGEYIVRVKYYESGSGYPTMARVFILLFEGTAQEQRHVFPVMIFKPGVMVTVGKFKIE